MTTKLELFLTTRADALRRGDRGVYKAMTAELAHLGYVETEPLATEFPTLDVSAHSQVNSMLESAQAAPMEEMAVIGPPKRRGRPPKVPV